MTAQTEHARLREYINQVVNDPAYKKIATIPLISWPQIALIVFSYLCVFGGIALYLNYDVSLWILYPIMVFGFYTAFTPLHDATHKAISSNSFVNNLLGTISANLLLPGANTTGYRYIHLTHHRYVGDEELDPDELLVSWPTRYPPFGYLALFIPDFIWGYWLFAKVWKRTPIRLKVNIILMLSLNFAFHTLWFMSPYWFEYLILFFIPNRLGQAYTAFAFAHVQHGDGEIWDDHPFQATFQMKGNWFYLKSLWGQANHHMHHFLPHIPWFRYKDTLSLANGIFRQQPTPRKSVLDKPDKHYLTKVKAEQSGKKVLMEVLVDAVEEMAPDIKQFTFKRLDGREMPEFSAGSHLQVHLPSGKIRSYSLINSPLDRTSYKIAVKREANGKGGSQEMHEEIKEGKLLSISFPKNNFVLYENVQKYILISGGIGITPLISMAHRLTDLEKHFEFHICARDKATIPFYDEMLSWPFSPHIDVHLDKDGRSTMDLNALLRTPDQETLVYVCGPAGFNKWVQQSALKLGWRKDQIKQEIFSRGHEFQEEIKAFKLILQKSGKTLQVEKDLSIIDALNMHNIKVDYSCNQGTCGSCIMDVVEGEIDHRDSVLSPEEKMEGCKMCLCVSRAKGEKIVLDL
ncbi:MAG: fatty acid desaturase [Bacteroidota bacterium]